MSKEKMYALRNFNHFSADSGSRLFEVGKPIGENIFNKSTETFMVTNGFIGNKATAQKVLPLDLQGYLGVKATKPAEEEIKATETTVETESPAATETTVETETPASTEASPVSVDVSVGIPTGKKTSKK